MDVLVTYDVETTTRAGERRLREVAKLCEAHGVRVQYSVFECRLSETALLRFAHELSLVIDPGTDSVHLYRFPGDLLSSRTSLGLPVPRNPGDPWIL